MAIKAGQCAIYALCCPVTGAVRYVGKTIDPRAALKGRPGRKGEARFGVTPQLVSLIHLGRAWAHVTEKECVS